MMKSIVTIILKDAVAKGHCMTWSSGTKECFIGIKKKDRVFSLFGKELMRIEGRAILAKYGEKEIRELIANLKSVLGEN